MTFLDSRVSLIALRRQAFGAFVRPEDVANAGGAVGRVVGYIAAEQDQRVWIERAGRAVAVAEDTVGAVGR